MLRLWSRTIARASLVKNVISKFISPHKNSKWHSHIPSSAEIYCFPSKCHKVQDFTLKSLRAFPMYRPEQNQLLPQFIKSFIESQLRNQVFGMCCQKNNIGIVFPS